MTEFLTNSEAAKFLKVSEQTLERWRQEGKPPKFYKTFGKVLYDKQDLIEWIKSGVVENE